MSNQTISEAARKAAKEMWFDAKLTARITGLYLDWERCAAPHIQSAIDAAAEPIDARIREIFKSNPTLKNFAEELARYRDAAARVEPTDKEWRVTLSFGLIEILDGNGKVVTRFDPDFLARRELSSDKASDTVREEKAGVVQVAEGKEEPVEGQQKDLGER